MAYPGLDVQLRLIDSFVDLHGSHLGEVDLVLRAGPLADTRLVATPLAYMVRIACASPAYLASRGVPHAPANCPGTMAWTGTAWHRRSPGASTWPGKPACTAPRMRMAANNAETLLFGALAGLGVAHLPTWLISEYLLRGELMPLFCDGGLPEAETSGIYALRLEHETNSRSRLLLGIPQEPLQPDSTLGPGLAQ